MRTLHFFGLLAVGGVMAGLVAACSGDSSDTTDTGDSGTAAKDSSSGADSGATGDDSGTTSDDASTTTDSSTADDSGPADSGATYQVGGMVSGLSGTVVLQNNGGDNLSITSDGAFHFSTTQATGAAYAVTVLTNPASPVKQTCSVSNGTGTVGSANVSTVTVTCVSTPTVAVTVSGLKGAGLVLKNNDADDLTVAANGTATFTTALAAGGAYAVTVGTQPAGQTCDVVSGTGNATNNVTDVIVNCFDLACGTGDESSNVAVTCPAGSAIVGFQFASYGTPTGTCGTFAASACNSVTSSSQVTTACIGQASCVVPASNGLFGDPCGGTFKRLYVAAKCAPYVSYENFDSMSAGTSGTQCNTGTTVYSSTDVTGWTKSGTNAVQGVLVAAGDKAATFYADNSIIMSTGVAANTNNTTYTVRFRSGPSVSSNCAEATQAADGLVIDVVRADNSVLKTFTSLPGAWPATQIFAPSSFTYMGDGTGAVRLRVSTNNAASGHFGGAIDNIGIFAP